MTDLNGASKIKEFLDYVSEGIRAYDVALENMKTEEKRTQDYLHQLELEDIKYDECAEIAAAIAITRKDRRYYKDLVEELEPIHKFNTEHSAAINALRKTLGDVRKQEHYHQKRTYKPKCVEAKKEVSENGRGRIHQADTT